MHRLRAGSSASTQALAAKVATVFRHVPTATIAAAINMEHLVSANASPEAIQDAIVRKLLWYQSLPDEAGTPVVPTVAIAPPPLPGTAAPATGNPRRISLVASTTLPGATTVGAPSVGSAAAAATSSTVSSSSANTAASVMASGVPGKPASANLAIAVPRIGNLPAFTTTGWLQLSEAEPYTLAVTQLYLRSKYDGS